MRGDFRQYEWAELAKTEVHLSQNCVPNHPRVWAKSGSNDPKSKWACIHVWSLWNISVKVKKVWYSLFSILPPVSAPVWDRESDDRRRRQQQAQQQQQALVTASRAAPPYGHRKGWLPRSQDVRLFFFLFIYFSFFLKGRLLVICLCSVLSSLH